MKGRNPLLELKGGVAKEKMKFKTNHIPSLELHLALSNLFDVQNVKGCKNDWRNVSIFLYSENKDLYVWGWRGGGLLRIKKTTNQTKSNYFYYHIVLLQLYSEIFFRSEENKKKDAYLFSFIFFFPVFDFAP